MLGLSELGLPELINDMSVSDSENAMELPCKTDLAVKGDFMGSSCKLGGLNDALSAGALKNKLLII